jgi:hypothetical protein
MALLPPIGGPTGSQPLMPEDRGAKASSEPILSPELPMVSGTEITPEDVIANSKSLIERKNELPSQLAEMSEVVSQSDGHLPLGPFVQTAGQLGDIGIPYLSALLTRASEE